MKFSIVIPTHDRSSLLAVVVRHAMQPDHPDFDVIVSDNSTTEEYRQLNLRAISDYIDQSNIRIVYPPRILSAPEHFEFALQYATGDYVTFITDKMVVLPDLLTTVSSVIEDNEGSIDIVNWVYHSFSLSDHNNPMGGGYFNCSDSVGRKAIIELDLFEELSFKASGRIPRNRQSMSSYVSGKICFGFYSRELIAKVLNESGALFGGVTHDYSSMIQALLLARRAILISEPMMIFLSHRKISIGTATQLESSSAKKYYSTFLSSELVLKNLAVPHLYSSIHNMVATDYVKYLELYNKKELFKIENWVKLIQDDLNTEGKVWISDEEHASQLAILQKFMANLNIDDIEGVFLEGNNADTKYIVKKDNQIRASALRLLRYLPGWDVIKGWLRVYLNQSRYFDSLDNAIRSLKQAD